MVKQTEKEMSQLTFVSEDIFLLCFWKWEKEKMWVLIATSQVPNHTEAVAIKEEEYRLQAIE